MLPQHAVLPGRCLCAFASGCTGVSQILSQTAQASLGAGDLHQLPASTSHLQSLFGQANPIWKTVTVLLPSSPLESGASMRNSYEFLCIRSTTCRKKNEKEKKNETRDFFFMFVLPMPN